MTHWKDQYGRRQVQRSPWSYSPSDQRGLRAPKDEHDIVPDYRRQLRQREVRQSGVGYLLAVGAGIAFLIIALIAPGVFS
jgi:hypothetical protein